MRSQEPPALEVAVGVPFHQRLRGAGEAGGSLFWHRPGEGEGAAEPEHPLPHLEEAEVEGQ